MPSGFTGGRTAARQWKNMYLMSGLGPRPEARGDEERQVEIVIRWVRS